MCKILAIGIIVLFVGVAVAPCIIGEEILRLRIYNTFIEKSETNPNNGSLSGYVNDTVMNPIQGARVRVSFHETYEEDYSDENGYYHVTNIPICYCLKNASCSKECYITEWVLLAIDENTTYDFILDTANHPPNAPSIKGPKSVQSVSIKANEMNPLYVPPGTHEFRFKATDPDGDDIRYHIDWSDGHYEKTDFYPSGEEIKLNHTYNDIDEFTISACAEDTCGAFGPVGTMGITITRNRDCGYNSVSNTDLIKVERLLNRVEVYSKLLLVLSRCNPEIQEEIEELLDIINSDSLWDFPIICDILESIGNQIQDMLDYLNDLISKFQDNPIILSIITAFYYLVEYIDVLEYGLYWIICIEL